MSYDLKFILVFFGSIFLTAALIIGSVLFFTRNQPRVYLYCSPGWSAICIRSKNQLKDVGGCVANQEGRVCGTYEVKYGQY